MSELPFWELQPPCILTQVINVKADSFLLANSHKCPPFFSFLFLSPLQYHIQQCSVMHCFITPKCCPPDWSSFAAFTAVSVGGFGMFWNPLIRKAEVRVFLKYPWGGDTQGAGARKELRLLQRLKGIEGWLALGDLTLEGVPEGRGSAGSAWGLWESSSGVLAGRQEGKMQEGHVA